MRECVPVSSNIAAVVDESSELCKSRRIVRKRSTSYRAGIAGNPGKLAPVSVSGAIERLCAVGGARKARTSPIEATNTTETIRRAFLNTSLRAKKYERKNKKEKLVESRVAFAPCRLENNGSGLLRWRSSCSQAADGNDRTMYVV